MRPQDATRMKLSAPFLSLGQPQRLDKARLRVLIFMRWYALLGVSLAMFLAWWLGFAGLNWSALLVFVVLGIAYNWMLSSLPEVPEIDSFQSIYHLQLVLDISALTGLLWASGGLSNPMSNLFVLHVVVSALIGTRTSVILAGSLACVAAIGLHVLAVRGFLLGQWAPPPRLDDTLHLLALLLAAVSTASVVGLLSARFQAREARLTEARQLVRLREQVLDRVVSGLSVAVEVVRDGEVIWQNDAMQFIRPKSLGEPWLCPGALQGCNRANVSAEAEHGGHTHSGPCDQSGVGLGPDEQPQPPPKDGSASCLVRVRIDGKDRVFRKFSWQLQTDSQLEVVHLYVDETVRLAEDERLKFTERLASLGRMAQGLAHELNTPLSTVRTLTQDVSVALRESPEVPHELRLDVAESLDMSLRELERCARIIRSLLQGRGLQGTNRPQLQPLAPIIQNAVALVSVGNRRQHPFLVQPTSAQAYVDGDVMIQVLVNLLTNAADASPPGTAIEIQVNEETPWVLLQVLDRGAGIPQEIRGRLFEPFATTKPVGQGTGLGLYTVRQLLADVGGQINMQDREGGGTVAEVSLRRETSAMMAV